MSLYKTELERHLFEWPKRKQKELKKGYLIALAIGAGWVGGWIGGAVTAAILRMMDRKHVERRPSAEPRRPLGPDL